MTEKTLSRITAEFLSHRDRDYRGSSKLYEELSGYVAAEPELLKLASYGPTPVPNLFFGGVHYLLMRGEHDPLAEYFPNLHKQARSGNDLFPAFRSFCLNHREALIAILSARSVQTNEVSRCAYLFPAFSFASSLIRDKSLGMVDVGSSLGLNLLWDRYGYDYGVGRTYGDADSPVKIESVLRGSRKPHFTEMMPKVGSRIGIELHPISPHSTEDILWLDALIWPEHDSRRKLFREATDLLRRENLHITIVEGDAGEILGRVLRELPENELPCVFQTNIWRQLSDATKAKLLATVESFGGDRSILFVSALKQLSVDLYSPWGHRRWILANYEQHGRWLEWLMDDPQRSS